MFTQSPVPLGERVEFLSDAYLDTIEMFVICLQGSWPKFSVSLRCANSPAHISSEVVGYTLGLSGSGVTLTPSATNEAYLLQDLDYNTALWLHSIVKNDNDATEAR